MENKVLRGILYLLALATVILSASVLKRNYSLYKYIRVKRLFIPIPKDSFYNYSERKMDAVKQYNKLLKLLYLLILFTVSYFLICNFLQGDTA